MTTAQPTFSEDGRWFWGGSGWIPATPAPGEVGRPGRCSWDGQALDLVTGFPVRAVLWLCAGTVFLAALAAAVWFATLSDGVSLDGTALVLPVLLTCGMLAAPAIGAFRLVFELHTLHLDAAGVTTRRRGRPPRFVPWEKVRQVGTTYQMVPLVCIDIDPSYWTDRGRPAPHRPALVGGWTSFSGSEHMILLYSRLLPITEGDFLRCARTLAPSSVSVHRGLHRW